MVQWDQTFGGYSVSIIFVPRVKRVDRNAGWPLAETRFGQRLQRTAAHVQSQAAKRKPSPLFWPRLLRLRVPGKFRATALKKRLVEKVRAGAPSNS
jgi:hypothetical protein